MSTIAAIFPIQAAQKAIQNGFPRSVGKNLAQSIMSRSHDEVSFDPKWQDRIGRLTESKGLSLKQNGVSIKRS